MPSGILLTGKRFGSLTVGRELRLDTYRCTCVCGATITAFRSQLTKGVLRNCGCTLKRRGNTFGHIRYFIGRSGRRRQKASSEYLSYLSMRSRCLYKTTTGFELWGGRGIQICERWLEPRGRGFANFLHDLHARPVGTSLDRKNPNGHYEPGNCRWAQKDVQHGNRRCILWPGGEGEPPVVPIEQEEEALACG
jgi:hypothetical protein